MRILFLQFLGNQSSPCQGLKEFCKRHLVGGSSVTGATLSGALGEPLMGAWGPRRVSLDDFDLAAISFNTPGAPRAYREARNLRASGKTVIAGGPHPSVLPNEAAQYFDAVCMGAGDEAFPAMVNDARRGRLKRFYEGRPGAWAIPSRRTRRGLALVQTSRGCFGRCRFCSVPAISPGGFDEKPSDLLAKELAQTPRRVSIVDDNFLADPGRADRVLQILSDAGKRFICQVSPEVAVNRQLIKRLALSGCVMVGVGMESIRPESRAFLGKSSRWEPKEVIDSVQEAGMACYLNLCFGSDGEAAKVFDDTLAFLDQARPAIVSPHLLTPFPGTPLFDYLWRQGRILHAPEEFPEAWARFDTRHVTFVPNPMKPAELQSAFAAFLRDLFSLRQTVQRVRLRHVGMAVLSSLLKNAY